MEPTYTTSTPVSDISATPHHNKKHTLLVVLGIVIIIIIFGACFYLYNKQKTYTIEEMDQLLRNVSTPVTATPEEQVVMMESLKGTSGEQTATQAEREQMLNQLSQ